MTPLLGLERRWECPNCTQTAVTHKLNETPGHMCRGLRGLSVPLVPAGTKCKIEAVERQDYVGREMVQTDAAGRPVMAAVTTRDDGQDCAVYAPAATLAIEPGEMARLRARLRVRRAARIRRLNGN